MPIDERLLAILVCPACRGAVRPDRPEERLDCEGCGRTYPIRDGIPVMLVEEEAAPARGEAEP
jgi:uncharacterized protein YbaR (Trm112 family)